MINEQIRDKEIRLIGENGEQLGIMSAKLFGSIHFGIQIIWFDIWRHTNFLDFHNLLLFAEQLQSVLKWQEQEN